MGGSGGCEQCEVMAAVSECEWVLGVRAAVAGVSKCEGLVEDVRGVMSDPGLHTGFRTRPAQRMPESQGI